MTLVWRLWHQPPSRLARADNPLVVSGRRVVASTVAEVLGIAEERARELMGARGPLAEWVVEKPNPHHYSGPKMRIVPLDRVLEWADHNGDLLERWQTAREKSLAKRSRSKRAAEEDEG